MSYFRRFYRDTITYWSPGGHDMYGNPTWSDPVTFKGRWESKFTLIMDNTGNEIVSPHTVWVPISVSLGGYIYKGTSVASNPNTVSGAREIKGLNEVPSLDGRIIETVVNT